MVMGFTLTRNEVLDLMQELPAEHWLQVKLLAALTDATVKTPVAAKPAPAKKAIEKTLPVAEDFEINNQVHVSTRTPANSAGKCRWECYGWVCNKTAVEREMCAEHVKKTCYCGAPATHGCNVELQFVCGGPLCDKHRACARH